MLTSELPGLVSSLAFKKSMRWNSDVAYSRPMRWLLALHGSTVLPFNHGTLQAGSSTRVLRNSAQPEVTVGSAEEYAAMMQEHSISLAAADRSAAIWQEVQVRGRGSSCAGRVMLWLQRWLANKPPTTQLRTGAYFWYSAIVVILLAGRIQDMLSTS